MTDREKLIWMLTNSAMAVDSVYSPFATAKRIRRGVLVSTEGKSQREVVEAMAAALRKAGMLK